MRAPKWVPTLGGANSSGIWWEVSGGGEGWAERDRGSGITPEAHCLGRLQPAKSPDPSVLADFSTLISYCLQHHPPALHFLTNPWPTKWRERVGMKSKDIFGAIMASAREMRDVPVGKVFLPEVSFHHEVN